MSLLVVNADDAGFAATTDAAILRCARDGIVRAATVAVNGATAPEFVGRARDAGLEIGLHFNLTEGHALTGPHASLTDAGGRFRHSKEELWRRAVADRLDPGEIRKELVAQWQRLHELGARPTHVDGHNHVHLFPAARAALAEIAPGLWVRTGLGREPPPAFLPGAFAAWAPAGGPWRRADRFLGYAFAEEPAAEALLDVLEPGAGITEFMVHPGAREGSCFTVSPARDREAEILCALELKLGLKRRGFSIGGFSCA